MDYKKIAYGSFYDRKGRVWGINIFRRTDSALIARELSFEAEEAAVIEWNEFDLEQPIQGSSLTLRIISEADREWTGLYTVKNGDVVAEVTLDGLLWWRGSLDPETYEEPYERADDYTVELRFQDFGPLKRHEFVAPGEGGLIKTRDAISCNLLEIGTVSKISFSGLPVNTDISAISVPEGATVADMLAVGAGEDAFREDGDSDGYIKAWDALSALLRASNLRMVQRGGRIMLFNLQGLRDNAESLAKECVWSGDSQTLSVDRIASRVTVTHKGEADSNIVKELKTGREKDIKVLKLSYGYSPHNLSYESFSITLYQTSTWKKPENAWGFFSIQAGLDGVPAADGWMMWAYRNTDANTPFGTAADYPTYSRPQKEIDNPPSVAVSPATYIHLTDSPGVYNKAASGYLLKVEQEMLFDCRYNPFADDGDGDLLQSTQDTFAKAQFVYVMAYLTLKTESGKTYWWTNSEKINAATKDTNLFAPHSYDSGRWSEEKMPYWLQYRTKEKREDGQIIGGGWIRNKPFVPVPKDISYKNYSYNVYTQKLPDGDLIPLPPERGWLSLEVCAVVRCMGEKISSESALNAMRWILGKGASISIVDGNGNYEIPESIESEIKVICDNGAEDPVEVTPLLGSGGGYLGCRSVIINADGSAAGKGEPELTTATEIASQLCMRRTRLSGEAYINTSGPLTFTERLQTGRIFLLAKERMDLQTGWGDREITELVRTDIDGLEVRRNERVIYEGTADRGGRDGKDAEVYSIIPTASAVSIVHTKKDFLGNDMFVPYPIYVPPSIGGTVYITRGPDMMKTRDGVLKCRLTGIDGNVMSEETLATDGGVFDPVEIPQRSALMEFLLMTDDSEDAETLAICSIPIPESTVYIPTIEDGMLNFVDPDGNKMLESDFQIEIIDEDCGEWSEDGKYRNGKVADVLTGKLKRSHVWYRGCKFVCLTDLTKEPPLWNSPDWQFEEGNPDLTLDWAGSEDSVFEDDPEITLEVNASLYNQDLTDVPQVKWDWTRESWRDGQRDTANDEIWNAGHQNTGSGRSTLVMDDMNYQFGMRPEKLIYYVTATLLDEAGQPQQTSDGSPLSRTMTIEM